MAHFDWIITVKIVIQIFMVVDMVLDISDPWVPVEYITLLHLWNFTSN